MGAKHTPEPWTAHQINDDPKNRWRGIDGANGQKVCTFHGASGTDHTTTGANARRIVACVNACLGIPTEALEQGHLATVLRRFPEYLDTDIPGDAEALTALAKLEGR